MAFARTLIDAGHVGGGNGKTVDEAWEAMRENAFQAHRTRGLAVNAGERRTNRISEAILTAIDLNRSGKTAFGIAQGIAANPPTVTAPGNGAHQRVLPSSARLPLPRPHNDRLIGERRRRLVESWVVTQWERRAKQEEVQRVLTRAAGRAKRRVVPMSGDVVREKDAVESARREDDGPHSSNNIADQPIQSFMSSSEPRIPSTTPPPPASKLTIPAPPPVTAVHRSSRKRGMTPGQRARMADEVRDSEEERIDETEASVNTGEVSGDAIPAGKNTAELKSYDSGEPERGECGSGILIADDCADSATNSGKPTRNPVENDAGHHRERDRYGRGNSLEFGIDGSCVQ